MTQSNGNGKSEYKPEIEFEYYPETDIWIEKSSDGGEKFTYTEEVLEELDEDSESESNSDN
ncbi:MAG: hypothetical protein ACRC2R_26410 [Xenococcaceae cyanobacterium]